MKPNIIIDEMVHATPDLPVANGVDKDLPMSPRTVNEYIFHNLQVLSRGRGARRPCDPLGISSAGHRPCLVAFATGRTQDNFHDPFKFLSSQL